MTSWWIRKRIGWAGKWGKREHKYGRVIALAIVVAILCEHITWNNHWFMLFKKVNLYVVLLMWLVYIVSHKIEKKCYGHHGSRG